MAANQKPLNQIGIFWYQFTPRKLLYLMISRNLVKFGPHFFGPPCIFGVFISSFYLNFSLRLPRLPNRLPGL